MKSARNPSSFLFMESRRLSTQRMNRQARNRTALRQCPLRKKIPGNHSEGLVSSWPQAARKSFLVANVAACGHEKS